MIEVTLSRCDSIAFDWRQDDLNLLCMSVVTKLALSAFGFRRRAMEVLASRLVTVSSSMARCLIVRCQGQEF